MSSGRIAQHRNYGNIMARHERDIRIKRIIRIFTYFLLVIVMVLIFFFVHRYQKKQEVEPTPQRTAYAQYEVDELDS
jgi:hypothetical protein